MKLKKTPLLIFITFLTVFLTPAGNTWAVEPNINTTLVSSYDTQGNANEIYVLGNYAYVADGRKGLQIIDITNPKSPSLVGSHDTPGSAYGVYVLGNYAYVADWNSGLQIIDISNPKTPFFLGSYDLLNSALRVYVLGNYAYVADSGEGLQIIDVTNPKSPSLVGSHDTPGYAYGVYVLGNYAYVADMHGSLRIIDISNPKAPSYTGSYDTTMYGAEGVYVLGNYAYIADYDKGLVIIDISNPKAPLLVSSYKITGYAYGVYLSGNYAYVAYGESGLLVIDITNPKSPSLAGSYNTLGNSRGVYTSEGYVYLADGVEGLQIIQLNAGTSTITSYRDLDKDGYGDTNDSNTGDSIPEGYVVKGSDCNDSNNTIYPGAVEICGDGIDQDCTNGDLVCPTDADADGYYAEVDDCNDNDDTIHPGATEICGDGIDQDCTDGDLVCPTDTDNDGYYAEVDDCNDNDNTIHPGATEICDDGIDQNCDNQDFTACQSGTQGTTYNYISIDYPGAIATQVNGINNSGNAVGMMSVGDGSQPQGFLYDDSKVGDDKYEKLEYPGGYVFAAYDINDSGQIVGEYGDGDRGGLGFLYKNGTYTKIEPPGATVTYVRGINNSGDVVGYYVDLEISKLEELSNDISKMTEFIGNGGILHHGFIYSSGKYTTIEHSGNYMTNLSSTNDNGQALEISMFGLFLYENNTFTDIDSPSGAMSNLSLLSLGGINNSGYIVAGGGKVFKYDNKVDSTKVQHPGAMGGLTYTFGINDNGDVAGGYGIPGGVTPHGFIAKLEASVSGPTIQPEPKPDPILTGEDFTTKIEISYDSDIKTSVLYWRSPGGAYANVSMINGSGNTWTGTVEASDLSNMSEVEYYISAEGKDGSSVGTEPKTVEITVPPVPLLSEWGMFMLIADFGFIFWKRREIFCS